MSAVPVQERNQIDDEKHRHDSHIDLAEQAGLIDAGSRNSLVLDAWRIQAWRDSLDVI